MTTVESKPMGRVTVEIELANNFDILKAAAGELAAAKVRRARVSATVDTGATRLVLPARVVADLGLPAGCEVDVRYADQRVSRRPMVNNVWLKLLERSSEFSAVVEPECDMALVGAIVMNELDLLVDCSRQSVRPRDPERIISEIESVAS